MSSPDSVLPVWNQDRFVELLGRLVAVGRDLQNAPDRGLVPQEELAAEVVLDWLAPHIARGVIRAERLAGPGFERRPSLVLTLKGSGSGTVGFVGAHFDVVPADAEAEGWIHDPFSLHRTSDDVLFGRGVSDALGNLAVAVELLRGLAERGEPPRRTVAVVLIANEESVRVPGVGLDYVVQAGALAPLRQGPIYWLDSTDFGPTVGTGGVARWDLRVTGVTGHSGMAHNCVNALELAMAATRALGEWFVEAFPPHPEERRYGFPSPSTLKPTLIDVPNRKFTMIPGRAQVTGDVRLTPFYEMRSALAALEQFVADLDRRLESGNPPPGFPRIRVADGRRGTVAIDVADGFLEGMACDLDSPGLAVLQRAISSVRGERDAGRYAMTASLPLIRELQRDGFDVQITGFGIGACMHAPDEHGRLQDFVDGLAVLWHVVEHLE
jgi:acetylornithine deacetylase